MIRTHLVLTHNATANPLIYKELQPEIIKAHPYFGNLNKFSVLPSMPITPDHLYAEGTRQEPPFVAAGALLKLFMSLMIQVTVLTCTSETSSYRDMVSLFKRKPIINVVLAKPCMRDPPVRLLLSDANGSVKPGPAYGIPAAANCYNCTAHLWEPRCPSSNLFSYMFSRGFFDFMVDFSKWCPLCQVRTSHHTIRTRVKSEI